VVFYVFKGLVGKAKIFILTGLVAALIIIMLVGWLSISNPEVVARLGDLILQHGYFGVFFSTIIAGSVIPFGSPIIVAVAAGFGLNIPTLALIAATGYTLGVLTSYIPAWLLGEKYVKRKMGEEKFLSYVEAWNRYGYKICALLSFMPGFPVDLLALICGCFHTKAKWFLPISWTALLAQFIICGYIGQLIAKYILPPNFQLNFALTF
jgi:membrane protein YqaA with SNARE-associated domain